jgi:HEAT repeat protein
VLTEDAMDELRGRVDAAAGSGDIACLIGILKEEHWQARQAACFALGEMGGDAVDPLLEVVRDSEADEYARGHAILSLREIGEASTFEPLLACLDDDVWQVRGYAARAVGVFADSRATQPLIDTYHRDDTEHCSVRNWVAGSLHEIGDPAALEFLREVAENDVDGGVKATARRAVEELTEA